MSADTKTKWEEHLDKAADALDAGNVDVAMGWVAVADAASRAVLADKAPTLA